MNRQSVFRVDTDRQATAAQAIEDLTAFLTGCGIAPTEYALSQSQSDHGLYLTYHSETVEAAVLTLLAWDKLTRNGDSVSTRDFRQLPGYPNVDVSLLAKRRFAVIPRSEPHDA